MEMDHNEKMRGNHLCCGAQRTDAGGHKKWSMEISRKNKKLQKPRCKVKKKFILFICVCLKKSPMRSAVL